MPRNGSGVYSQPANTAAVSGATISSTAYNTLIDDIGDEITASLPISGTVAMTGALKVADGTAGSPAVQFSTAATNGLYKSSNGIGFSIGGALVAEVRSGGLYDASGALYVSATSSQTLTNKTLTSPTISTPTVSGTATFSGQIRVSDGTVSAPSIAFSSDGSVDTGLYWGGDGVINFAANAGLVAQIAAGGVQIGSPTGGLQGAGTLNATALYVNGVSVSSAGAGVTSVATSGGITGGPITATGTISLDTNNALGIGSIILARNGSVSQIASGTTVAGSTLAPAGINSTDANNPAMVYSAQPSGTWRNISGCPLEYFWVGLWQRTA